MIITDEELLALMEVTDEHVQGFHPVTVYALDGVAYEAALAAGLPAYATLRRTRPDACWQWEGLFTAGAIALFEPAVHRDADYLPHLLATPEGIYSLTSDWQQGLSRCYQQWCDWLRHTPVLLLEDHPFQGEHIRQVIEALDLPCQWVQDEEACLAALAQGNIKLLVCDLSLVEQDAIGLLMGQPQLQTSGLPIVLLSAHDQTLIDGARRLLHDAGFNVIAALAKPLLVDDFLRLLKEIYQGPQRQQRLVGLRRTLRDWRGSVCGQVGLVTDPFNGLPLWLAVSGLPARWELLKERLARQGREPEQLTLLIHRRDHLLTHAERFGLVLQASLAGCKLGLLIDTSQHLPFELLERLPLQSILLGQAVLPELESLVADSLLGRFIARTRELGIQLYLDDPFNLLDAEVWRERGFAGSW